MNQSVEASITCTSEGTDVICLLLDVYHLGVIKEQRRKRELCASARACGMCSVNLDIP